MNKTYIIILIIVVFFAVGTLVVKYFYEQLAMLPSSIVTNFEECAKIYPVMESYPAQCKTPDGKHFTQILPKETVAPPVQLEKITNFKECAESGSPITMSYPRQCRSTEGKTFTEFTQ